MFTIRVFGLALAAGALALSAAAVPAAAETTNPGLLGWASFPNWPAATDDLPSPPPTLAAPRARPGLHSTTQIKLMDKTRPLPAKPLSPGPARAAKSLKAK